MDNTFIYRLLLPRCQLLTVIIVLLLDRTDASCPMRDYMDCIVQLRSANVPFDVVNPLNVVFNVTSEAKLMHVCKSYSEVMPCFRDRVLICDDRKHRTLFDQIAKMLMFICSPFSVDRQRQLLRTSACITQVLQSPMSSRCDYSHHQLGYKLELCKQACEPDNLLCHMKIWISEQTVCTLLDIERKCGKEAIDFYIDMQTSIFDPKYPLVCDFEYPIDDTFPIINSTSSITNANQWLTITTPSTIIDNETTSMNDSTNGQQLFESTSQPITTILTTNTIPSSTIRIPIQSPPTHLSIFPPITNKTLPTMVPRRTLAAIRTNNFMNLFKPFRTTRPPIESSVTPIVDPPKVTMPPRRPTSAGLIPPYLMQQQLRPSGLILPARQYSSTKTIVTMTTSNEPSTTTISTTTTTATSSEPSTTTISTTTTTATPNEPSTTTIISTTTTNDISHLPLALEPSVVHQQSTTPISANIPSNSALMSHYLPLSNNQFYAPQLSYTIADRDAPRSAPPARVTAAQQQRSTAQLLQSKINNNNNNRRIIVLVPHSPTTTTRLPPIFPRVSDIFANRITQWRPLTDSQLKDIALTVAPPTRPWYLAQSQPAPPSNNQSDIISTTSFRDESSKFLNSIFQMVQERFIAATTNNKSIISSSISPSTSTTTTTTTTSTQSTTTTNITLNSSTNHTTTTTTIAAPLVSAQWQRLIAIMAPTFKSFSPIVIENMRTKFIDKTQLLASLESHEPAGSPPPD